ncbi:hypothetical protein GCM10027087_02670 [Paractinoplanes abujensis]
MSASPCSTAAQKPASAGVPADASAAAEVSAGWGQKCRRWKAYVGSATVAPPPSTARQSTSIPATNASANELSNLWTPPSPRRSVPTVIWSSITGTSTGCGDTSTNTPCPDSASTRTARSNSTGSRNDANQ